MNQTMAVLDSFTSTNISYHAQNISCNNILHHHIHPSTKSTPSLLPEKSSPSGVTHCGFEGPEKLLEVWFSSSSCPASPDSALSTGKSPAMSITTASLIACINNHHSIGPESNGFEEDRWYNDNNNVDQLSLRSVPREVWDDMLAIVKAQILSTVHNEYADAYLLSESSMFVYPRKLILKTCGTTTLLHAVPRILEIASQHCGLHQIDHIFYSRKSFTFPDKQIFPHGRWGDEVAYLDYLFPELDFNTAGYVVGKVNGDHWCCYLASPRSTTADDALLDTNVSSGNTDRIATISPSWSDSESDDGILEEDPSQDDVTLEIMMAGLDIDVAKVFWRDPNASPLQAGNDAAGGKHRTEELRVYNETGLADLYPTSKIDHHIFDPCGYSLNGLMGPYYWTVHVTPEDHCSYASFETSAPVRKFYSAASENHIAEGHSCYDTFEEVINRVVSCFRPSNFCVSLFIRKSVGMKHKRGVFQERIPGFDRRDCIKHESGKWEVLFSRYEKKNT